MQVLPCCISHPVRSFWTGAEMAVQKMQELQLPGKESFHDCQQPHFDTQERSEANNQKNEKEERK